MIDKVSPFIIAGHVVLDEIFESKTQTTPRRELGGAVCYSSLAIKSLGHTPRVVTRVGRDLAKEYIDYLKKFAGVNLENYMKQDQDTTRYRIDRTGKHRKLWLLTRSGDLTGGDFERATDHFTESDALILNPVAGEVTLNLLEQMSAKFKYVFLDSQGFVRSFEPETGLVLNKTISDCSALDGVFALKADREELFSWTGIKDTKKSIEKILRYAQNLILTSGADVVKLYSNDKSCRRSKPLDVKVKDTTGAGDVMLASFAVRYCETENLDAALEFATVASSLATQTVGVSKAILSRNRILSNSKKVRVRRSFLVL